MSENVALNPGIAHLEMPDRIRRLPVDARGFPIPWFVAWLDGKPEFRCMEHAKLTAAVQRNLCWVCGDTLGRFRVSLIGPMCSINRTISEPPSHKDCALYSVRACPFLSRPAMHRRENDLPEDRHMAGMGIMRNPGVVCLWVRDMAKNGGYHVVRDPKGEGVLFRLGDPCEVLWFAEGRAATRAEVLASVDSGFPLLYDMALKQGPDAVAQLNSLKAKAEKYWPKD